MTSGPSPCTETILIVDDQEGDRRLISMTLGELGYKLLEAKDGVSALEIFKTTPHIDLVLTDILMPGMDGVELVEQIRAISPKINVLYISSFSQDYAHKLSGSKIDVLHKTHDFSHLPEKIRDVLDASKHKVKSWMKKLRKKD
jgi:two-component system, cell cycle sensor histidine kinase and response regulator CckA